MNIEGRAGNPQEQQPQPFTVEVSRQQIVDIKAKAIAQQRDLDRLQHVSADSRFAKVLLGDARTDLKYGIEIYNRMYETLGDGQPTYIIPQIEPGKSQPSSVEFQVRNRHTDPGNFSLLEDLTHHLYPLQILPIEQYKAQPNYEKSNAMREAIKEGRTVVLMPSTPK